MKLFIGDLVIFACTFISLKTFSCLSGQVVHLHVLSLCCSTTDSCFLLELHVLRKIDNNCDVYKLLVGLQ